jgi:hypothetical protein
MILTKEKIEGFKKKEEKANTCYDLKEVADNIAKAGDKEWSNLIYDNVINSYSDSESVNDFTSRLCDVLTDSEWSTKSKKDLEGNYIRELGSQFIKIAQNVIFRLTKGKYARIFIPLDKDEIYIVDTFNNLMIMSSLDLTIRDQINLAITLTKKEILKRLKI